MCDAEEFGCKGSLCGCKVGGPGEVRSRFHGVAVEPDEVTSFDDGVGRDADLPELDLARTKAESVHECGFCWREMGRVARVQGVTWGFQTSLVVEPGSLRFSADGVDEGRIGLGGLGSEAAWLAMDDWSSLTGCGDDRQAVLDHLTTCRFVAGGFELLNKEVCHSGVGNSAFFDESLDVVFASIVSELCSEVGIRLLKSISLLFAVEDLLIEQLDITNFRIPIGC